MAMTQHIMQPLVHRQVRIRSGGGQMRAGLHKATRKGQNCEQDWAHKSGSFELLALIDQRVKRSKAGADVGIK